MLHGQNNIKLIKLEQVIFHVPFDYSISDHNNVSKHQPSVLQCHGTTSVISLTVPWHHISHQSYSAMAPHQPSVLQCHDTTSAISLKSAMAPHQPSVLKVPWHHIPEQ
jgi:hypothetical protein